MILLYVKTNIIDINNEETLILLYRITRNYDSKSSKNYFSNEMCFLKNSNDNDMIKVLIYKYIFFIFTRNNINIVQI